jgi:hypothetical protein
MIEHATKPTAPPQRKRSKIKDPGGSPEARRMAAAILEVWAGVRTPSQAASALGVSQPRFYQLEQRTVGALVASCEPRQRGPGASPQRQVRALERQLAVSRRDCARLTALLRTSQRTIGLPAAEPPAPKTGPGSKNKPVKGKRRARRPAARALRLAEVLGSPGGSPGEGLERKVEAAAEAAGSATVAKGDAS